MKGRGWIKEGDGAEYELDFITIVFESKDAITI